MGTPGARGLAGEARDQVVVLGAVPGAGSLHESLGLIIKEVPDESLTPESLEKELSSVEGARGAVVIHAPGKDGRTFRLLEIVVPLAQKCGTAVHVVLDSESQSREQRIATISANPPVRQWFSNAIGYSWNKVLIEVYRHNPQASRNTKLDIRPDTLSLDTETRILLERCFYDCTQIVLRRLTEGKSGASYQVFASRTPETPQHLDTLFFKVDTPENIVAERSKYKTYVVPYIASHLRPGLEEDRCYDAMFKSKGAIVGDFVRDTETLQSAVRRGHGFGAVHSLIEHTLDEWFRASSPWEQSMWLEAHAGGIFKPANYGAHRTDVIARAHELGLKLEPEEILEQVKQLECPQYLRGVIHGDLHARNVLVRSGDALVIDFNKCSTGPALNDIASLDVSVVFDCTVTSIATEWQNWTRSMYTRRAVLGPPDRPSVMHTCEHPWRCIRYLRRFAREESRDRNEYPILLALHLLRRSTHNRDADTATGPEYADVINRSAHALVAARTLVESLVG